MEIEGYRTNIFSVTSRSAYITHTVLVDLIHSHVEADIICSSIDDVLHDSIVGITANFIMTLLISIQAQKNQISFREINGKRAICNYINDEKSHAFGFNNQISQTALAILPKECLTTTEEQNANTHAIELLHFLTDLSVGMNH